MKKKDFDAINEALVRAAAHSPKELTEKEKLVRNGTILGFMVWLAKYYDENKED